MRAIVGPPDSSTRCEATRPRAEIEELQRKLESGNTYWITMSAINPYEAPTGDNSPAAGTALLADASGREVFLAWEKLRVPYNVTLVLVTLVALVMLGTEFVNPKRLVFTIVVGGILANLCFCAGSCMEGYLNWLGLPRNPTRLLIFIAGLLLSSLFTLAAVYRISLPPF